MFFDEPKNHNSLKLIAMIDRACDPHQFEPNYALNLDICDFINEKQLGYPMEAALHIAKLANSRNQNEALLSLTLLDLCVKNCGYSFHLAIATKEFLNSLVRRFPEHPMTKSNPVQVKILESIELWKSTLCKNEKYKNDFKHIESMYNLLLFQGYSYPQVSPQAAAVMQNDNKGLKSEQELEAEDHAALSAKLQALLQKGTPGALEQANEIMKILAGYEPEKKPNYSDKVSKDLDLIHAQMMDFNDALDEFHGSKSGGRIEDNARIRELHGSAKVAQPKIQKFIEECQDENRMESLLVLNDVMNIALQKYEDLKTGKEPQVDETQKVRQQTLETSLIDLDFGGGPAGIIQLGSSPARAPTAKPSVEKNELLDDLVLLSLGQTPTVSADVQSSNCVFAEHNGVKLRLISATGELSARKIQFGISNSQNVPISNINLKIAAPKSMTLTMFPASGTSIPALSIPAQDLSQTFSLLNPQREPIKLRYRLEFVRNGANFVHEGVWNDSIPVQKAANLELHFQPVSKPTSTNSNDISLI